MSTNLVFSNYQDAYAEARRQARQLRRPMGLEAQREYGRLVYAVKMIPIRIEDRYGWETRCQVVEPTE